MGNNVKRKSYKRAEKKIETKFLWLPLTIKEETKWLTTTTILFKKIKVYTKGKFIESWEPVKFLNSPEEFNPKK